MIYKITYQGSEKVSYLMGTIHINESDLINDLTKAKNLMQRCEKYIGEMNLGLVIATEAIESMKIQDSEYLPANYFSQKKLEKIDFVLNKYFKMDRSVLADFYPLISQNNILKSKLKNDHSVGMDHELYLHAMSLDKLIDGLETPHEQYGYLEKLDIAVQWQQFYKFICMPNKSISQLKSMIDNYKRGRGVQLYKQLYKSLGKFRKIMLFDRNDLMTKRLLDHLIESTVFVTFGAGHLFGNNGIIAQLKKQGYKVEKYLDK